MLFSLVLLTEGETKAITQGRIWNSQTSFFCLVQSDRTVHGMAMLRFVVPSQATGPRAWTIAQQVRKFKQRVEINANNQLAQRLDELEEEKPFENKQKRMLRLALDSTNSL